MKKPIDVKTLAERLDAELIGDATIQIHGLGTLEQSNSNDLFCILEKKIIHKIDQHEFAALVTPRHIKTIDKPQIIVKNTRFAFALLLDWLYPEREAKPHVHNLVSIADSTQLHTSCTIDAFVQIGENSNVGERTHIFSNVSIGHNCKIGAHVTIHPNVTVYDNCEIGDHCIIHAGTVIGADGYGFFPDKLEHRKIPQKGNVIIEEQVEIGSNCTIDKATLGTTRIGAGTKMDDAVHIAHNVVIGKNCLLIAQVGIAGSCVLGDNCVVAGQAGISDHITLADRTVIGAQSGLGDSIKEPGKFLLGTPAKDARIMRRLYAAHEYLPDVLDRVRKLEDQITAWKPSDSAQESKDTNQSDKA